jgi:hypothetical protein
MDCDAARWVRGDLAASNPEAARQVEGVVAADILAALKRSTGAPFGGGYGERRVTVKDLEARRSARL